MLMVFILLKLKCSIVEPEKPAFDRNLAYVMNQFVNMMRKPENELPTERVIGSTVAVPTIWTGSSGICRLPGCVLATLSGFLWRLIPAGLVALVRFGKRPAPWRLRPTRGSRFVIWVGHEGRIGLCLYRFVGRGNLQVQIG